MIDQILCISLALWFAFYIVNHAELTKPLRDAMVPIMPGWLAYAISCALCFSFWTLTVLSLFVGFSPLLLTCPPTTLFINLLYLRLKPSDDHSS